MVQVELGRLEQVPAAVGGEERLELVRPLPRPLRLLGPARAAAGGHRAPPDTQARATLRQHGGSGAERLRDSSARARSRRAPRAPRRSPVRTRAPRGTAPRPLPPCRWRGAGCRRASASTRPARPRRPSRRRAPSRRSRRPGRRSAHVHRRCGRRRSQTASAPPCGRTPRTPAGSGRARGSRRRSGRRRRRPAARAPWRAGQMRATRRSDDDRPRAPPVHAPQLRSSGRGGAPRAEPSRHGDRAPGLPLIRACCCSSRPRTATRCASSGGAAAALRSRNVPPRRTAPAAASATTGNRIFFISSSSLRRRGGAHGSPSRGP